MKLPCTLVFLLSGASIIGLQPGTGINRHASAVLYSVVHLNLPGAVNAAYLYNRAIGINQQLTGTPGIEINKAIGDTTTKPLQRAIVRGDTLRPRIALVFTADEFGDGGKFITGVLKKQHVKASFFLTGNFYRNESYKNRVSQWIKDGHYIGSHSDKHLLYCDWLNRDSLMVTKQEFNTDLSASYAEMKRFGIKPVDAKYFLPPYEWYNDSIVQWTNESGLQLVCFTAGTRSTADYTYPEMGSRYLDSKTIIASILDYEQHKNLNGFILLMHAGTDPRRKDKLYYHLPALVKELKKRGYKCVKINELLEQ